MNAETGIKRPYRGRGGKATWRGLFAAAAWAGSLQAGVFTWSSGTSGSAVDGAGVWDAATPNWVDAGSAHSAWNNAGGDTAAFGAGGTAGTVTVAQAGIVIGGLTFNTGLASGTYTLAGGPLTLTGSPVFQADTNATLSALIAGTAGFTKTGGGTLTFACPSNTFSGDIRIAAGTAICNAINQGGTNSALGRADTARTIVVGSGATLQFSAHDTFGNDGKTPAVTISVEDGGTVRGQNAFTTLGALNLRNGTVISSGGANANYQAYQLKGVVTSGGNSAIATSGGSYNGVHLYSTLFAVTNGVLTLSAPVVNPCGVFAVPGGFTKSGSGTLVLAADNSFSGSATVSNGVLQVGGGGSIGTFGTGAGGICLVNADALLVFDRAGSTGVSGPLAGRGALLKKGTGVVALSGTNTYAGGTVVSNGVLAVTRTNALPGYATAGNVALNSGAGLSVGVGSWPASEIAALIASGVYRSDTLFGFDTTAGNYTYSGQFAVPTVAGIVKTGPYALTLAADTGCAGGVTVLGGILQADFGTGLSAATNVVLAGASLSSASGSLAASLGTGAGQIAVVSNTACGFSAVDVPLTVNLGGANAVLSWGDPAFNPSVLVLNDTGANTHLTFVNGLALNGATRTIAVNATASGAGATVGGAIVNGSGTASLVKSGAGLLGLSSTNTYTGGTTVNAGTLALVDGNDRLITSGAITINGGTLDLGGNSQTLASGDFVMANGATLQNGTLRYRNTSWNPSSYASVTFGAGGGFTAGNRMALMGGQTVTLATGAGAVCFGGDEGGSANYIGVDNAMTNAIVVNGGTLNYTNAASGAGNLRIGANGSTSVRPVGSLTVNGGAVNVGHSMNMGARWDNSVNACYGDAALTINGGEVNVGTGSGAWSACGARGWFYLGNANAGTVSRSTVALNGGTLSFVQLEAGAYGTNTAVLNGGILKARADNATFINGAKLNCRVGAGGAIVDTAGYTVGIVANLCGDSLASRLVKRGSGTLILNGSNTCEGVTSVEAGTLRLSSTAVFPTNGVATARLTDSALACLKLRLDASEVSTLFTNATGSGTATASGQPIGYWADLSGNGKAAIQTTTTCRPVYVANVAEFGGRSVLQFDGVDDDITSSLDINATNLPDATVMIAFRQVTQPVNSALWGHDDGNWDRMQLLKFAVGTSMGYSTEAPIATSGACASVKGLNTNAVVIYTASLRNGVAGGSYVYVNGQSDSQNGLPAFTSSEGTGRASFTLANISAGNTYHANLQIGEVLVFGAALSETDRMSAEAYLKNKWIGRAGRISVASGAVLDCGGCSQALTAVTGSGTLSNGTLTVSEPLSPGGEAIGVQAVSGLALNGTLLVDVTRDGACDQLAGTGALSLSGLTLQIAKTSLLNRGKTYTVVTCAGALTGTFASTNLPIDWHIRYDYVAGTATLYYAPPGTVIKWM